MIDRREPFHAQAFEYGCARNDVDHRLTKPKHPWTNGQVERMNRTIKDATVKRYFYERHRQVNGFAGLKGRPCQLLVTLCIAAIAFRQK